MELITLQTACGCALSGAAMTLTMTVLTAVPVVAMWRRRPARAD